ncbi:DUF302 domain-containing protein [Robiginitalea aurantiaca]|uniref:DUF302 domain-containing protein n=1 Tax=Robiginitalea aurantiaca TaxID=3056915 RepID=A0ABT7WE61_9FLAO|nr:DUF302 domain-containing protein [Robiginitalea aurantiaca]MDM9631104.1 DUF302 domain-containing protein [Robiginitalea aurantiaca]
MNYYFNTTLTMDFDKAIEVATAALKEEGFGVLTEIDIAQTMKKKLDVDLPPYKILGACNPQYAYRALQAENKIGTMLPCNVIVQDIGEGKVEVSAVNPMASMQAVQNPELGVLAEEVTEKLKRMIASL